MKTPPTPCNRKSPPTNLTSCACADRRRGPKSYGPIWGDAELHTNLESQKLRTLLCSRELIKLSLNSSL
ncbi:hypothetical protein BDW74DRAFT_149666 [Aspergillus multicolor]|uniref:uncharacterized protein n=1 Tax=Aspergillus multicolor TaxID=41759 RepID=UPI003CCDAD17